MTIMPIEVKTSNCYIFFEKKNFSKLKKPIRDLVFFIFSNLKKKNAYCSVYCVSRAYMKVLNKKYKNKNLDASVLSFPEGQEFPHPEVPKNKIYLGEIFISPDFLGEKDEGVGRFLLHGVLHLLGYTHKSACDRMDMESVEEKLRLYLSRKSAWF